MPAKQIEFLMDGIRHPETDQPLNGGVVWFYQAGSAILSNVWTSRDQSQEHANPAILDSFGRLKAYANGLYRIVIRDSADENGDILYEADNLEFKPSFEDSGNIEIDGDLDMQNFKIINLDDGVNPEDAINKGQLNQEINTLEQSISNLANVVNTKAYKDLTDVYDTSFTGKEGRIPVVEDVAGELKLVLKSKTDAIPDRSFLDLTDTIDTDYIGKAGKVPAVNGTEDNLELVDVDAKKIQGIPVTSSTPNNGDRLKYNGTLNQFEYEAPAASALVREEIFSGNSATVTFTSDTTPLLIHITFSFFGAAACMVVLDFTAFLTAGYYRIINRGGENADRNYDGAITINGVNGSYNLTCGGNVAIQKVVILK